MVTENFGNPLHDYMNELNKLNNPIALINYFGEENYRETESIGKKEYLLSKIGPIKLLDEKYPYSYLKKIMEKNPKENLKKTNALVIKINEKLRENLNDIGEFKSLINDICIYLNRDKIY